MTRPVPPFHRMPWYPRDFASATRTWPLDARGAYRELLDAQWDAGGSQPGLLPDDPEQLRELVRATPAQWKVAWKFIEAKFPQVDGGRRNERLEGHRNAAIVEFEKRRKGAHKTNTKRWGHRSNGDAHDIADDSVSES